MGLPWTPLTKLLLTDQLVGELDVAQAWEETAARLGVVRLGWFRSSGDPAQPPELELAYPSPRAVIRWRQAVAPGGAPIPGPGKEELAVVEGVSGRLIASAPRGSLPDRRALEELTALAAALAARRRDRASLDRARLRAAGAREVLGAAHDMRNELTRALLLEGRLEGDQGNSAHRSHLRAALRSARELAHGAIRATGVGTCRTLEPVPLRTLVEQEARAATESARVPEGFCPRLRLRIPRGVRVLARPNALCRAVRNLATNALEAAAARSGRQGTVSIWMEAAEDAAPEWSLGRLRAAGFSARLVIEDTGAGISRERLVDYLDAPPASGDGSHTGSKPGSTGLGTASLAAALLESGIPLRVCSGPGAGTRAELWLRQEPRVDHEVIVDRDLRRGEHRQALAGGQESCWWVATEAAASLLPAPIATESAHLAPAGS